MAVTRKKFIKGIRLPATSTAVTIDGELSNDGTSLKAHLGGQARTIVTTNQTQTISNKTLDLTNQIAYDDTVQTVMTLGATNVQAAIDSIKVKLDAQNEASEIAFNPVSPLTSTNVQNAVQEVQTNLTNHINQTSGAHAASAISYNNTSSALTATQVQAAIDELDGRIDTLETNTTSIQSEVTALVTLSGRPSLSTHLGSFTGSTIPDDVTIKAALQSLETAHETLNSNFNTHDTATTNVHGIGAGNSVVGTGTTQTLSNKTIQSVRLEDDVYLEIATDSTTTGSNAEINTLDASVIRLTNSSLVSVRGIIEKETSSFGGKIVLINSTGNDIIILNDVVAAGTKKILTGTGDDLELENNASIFLIYDGTSDLWRVVGGSGSGGGSSFFRKNAAAAITALRVVDVDTSGEVLHASNTNNRFVGIALETVSAGSPVKVQTSGVVKSFTGLTAGSIYYLQTNGTISTTLPTSDWQVVVGIALSSTELLINPDLGSSAKFVNTESYTINNDQTTVTDVAGLTFNSSSVRSAKVEYYIRRTTSTTELVEAGSFRVVYNNFTNTWTLGAQEYVGENSGVTLTINSSGQVRYTSTNLTGTGYQGTLKLIKTTILS